MVHQNLTGDKPSLHFSLNLANLKAETSLLSALSHLYYLDRHEPLNFAIQYSETRKELGFGIGEFKAIYTAYLKQRGAK
jgi:hypothetical protein